MSLNQLVDTCFGRDALAERPSFKGSSVEVSDGVFSIALGPRCDLFAGLPVLVGADWTEKVSRLDVDYGLIDVDGFYLGGMARHDCICGSAPAWVGVQQLSREPGRERARVMDELGLGSRPRIGGKISGLARVADSRSTKVVSANGGYLLQTHESRLGGSPFYQHRILRVRGLFDSDSAAALYHRFAQRENAQSDGARLVAQDNGQPVGLSFAYCAAGPHAVAELHGIYLDLMPNQQNEQAASLIYRTFG